MTVIDDVKSRLDLIEVVSGYVALQRSGRAYKANCPFHQERTPSFYVSPERQTWQCFGACATGGDVFSFIMRAENLEFSEALKRLAQQAGVTLPSRERRSEVEVSFRVNEAAREYFQQYLASSLGSSVRGYLDQRGLTKESADKFQLGLSPRDGQGLFSYLQKHGFTPEQLTLAGVVYQSQNGGYRDAFRGRLMIPIRNGQGDLGGFGSRDLDDSGPKYLNTARTPVFDKGRILFGLHLAKDAARQQGIVIVEGYMDVIMAHQYGFTNVVASMGTALTEHQVAEVRRLTDRVTMALDADAAGQQATLRSLESSWQVFQNRVAGHSRGTTLFQRQDNLELKVAVLPDGKDPDDVIRASTDDWSDLVSEGVPLFEYLLPALSTQVDASTPQGKARVVELLFPFIAAVQEPIQQDHYFRMLADHLSINEATLKASVSRFAAQAKATRPGSDQRARTVMARSASASEGSAESAGSAAFAALDRDRDRSPLEDYCLALLLRYPDLPATVPEVANLSPDYFRRPENREIFSRMTQVWAEAPALLIPEETLVEALKRRVAAELAEHLELLAKNKIPPLDSSGRAAALRDAVSRLEGNYLRELKLLEQARYSGDSAELPEEFEQEALDINRKLKANQSLRNRSTQNAFRGR